MVNSLLYVAILKPENFYGLIVWLISFIIIPSIIAYLSKNRLLYIFSIIILLITIFKFINYQIDVNRNSKLYIFKNKKELIFIVKRDNKQIKKRTINLKDIHNIKIEHIVEKDRGGLSPVTGSTFYYTAITFTDKKNNKKELISTRNMFDSKFISIDDINNIFNKFCHK